MQGIKKLVRVTIEKEIEIEIPPGFFEKWGDKSEAEYLENFRRGLWEVNSMDDVVKYAARMAAYYGGGYQHDGLGLLDFAHSTHPRVPDVKYRELSDESEEEIIDEPAAG